MWITLVQNLSHNFSFFIIFLPSVQNRQILSKSPPFKASGLTRCSLRQSRNDHHPTSPYLLGSVLERLFSRLVAMNTFTEMTLSSQQRGEIAHWQARMGKRTLI